jgi:hypothetical protein
MKKLFFLFLAFPLLVAGCGLREPLFELASTHPDSVPRITTFDPADNLYDVPRNALIAILFSKPMNQKTLKDNFSYSYNGKTYGASHGSFFWDSSSRLAVFRPYSFFPASTEVSVSVATHVKSKEGLNLEEGASWKFETSIDLDFGPNYNVTTYALNETEVVGIYTLDAQVVIEFDKEMMRSSVEGSFQLSSDDFQDIRTVNDGYFLWSEPMLGMKRAIFTPHEPLMPGKSYQVYLNANGMQAVDVAGNGHNGIMLLPLFTFQTIDAIYVSTTGDDSNEGYLSTIPVHTIGRALERAIEYSLPFIRIEEGNYNEDVVLDDPLYNGFSFQGGWEVGFVAYDPDPTLNRSSINAVSKHYDLTLSGVNGITLDTLFLIGPTTGPPDINGTLLIDGGSTNIWIYNCYFGGSDLAEQGHGIRITENSRNIDISNSRIYGANVATTNRSFGISIDNARDVYIHDNIEIYGGSASVNNAAIHIVGASDNVQIERNMIHGGWDGVLEGIYVGEGSQNILVQDNSLIYGGSAIDNNTYGILVEGGAVANIYRNTIHGGDDGGAGPNTHMGIRFNSAGNCNLFNNYIIGGDSGTDINNDSYGVYVQNCDVDIINNTIDGYGNVGAPAITTGIYGENTDSNIVNNIIIGGQGGDRYGISLSSYSTAFNDVLIYNNSFDINGCLDGFLSDGSTHYTDIGVMEAGYNSSPREPSNNNSFNLGVDVVFDDRMTSDYDINTATAVISNNGYDLSNLFSSTELQAATLDRNYETRSVTNPDRGGDEFP